MLLSDFLCIVLHHQTSPVAGEGFGILRARPEWVGRRGSAPTGKHCRGGWGGAPGEDALQHGRMPVQQQESGEGPQQGDKGQAGFVSGAVAGGRKGGQQESDW